MQLRIFSTLWQVCTVNYPDVWNGIVSRGPGRIVQRPHWSEILTEDMQKAWFGLCWELWKWLSPRFQLLFKHSQHFNTLFGSHGRYLNQAQSCVVKYLLINTYSLETRGKNTLSLPFFAAGLWERTCGKNKINGFHFILAISTPIKCKEKLKSGQQERWTVTRMMSDGRGVPRAHRWLFSQPWFSIQNGDFISGRVWKHDCSFPK